MDAGVGSVRLEGWCMRGPRLDRYREVERAPASRPPVAGAGSAIWSMSFRMRSMPAAGGKIPVPAAAYAEWRDAVRCGAGRRARGSGSSSVGRVNVDAYRAMA